MSWLVLHKLLAMFIVVALGWWAGRKRWLGEGDTARVLGNAAFMIFVPALLFRTAARLDLAALPWRTLAAFFVPAVLTMLVVYAVVRRRSHPVAPARAAVRAVTATYGNAVQVRSVTAVTRRKPRRRSLCRRWRLRSPRRCGLRPWRVSSAGGTIAGRHDDPHAHFVRCPRRGLNALRAAVRALT